MKRLSQRQLNRSFLARQDLLERRTDLVDVMHRHIAVQGQEHLPMYIGLLSRVTGFRRSDLDSLLASREAIRATTLRGTIHVSLVEDYRKLHAELQPGWKRLLTDYLQDLPNPDDWLPTAMEALSGEAMGQARIDERISAAIPDYNAGTFRGNPVMMGLGLVRVPRTPGGIHGGPRDLWTRADEWIGKPYLEPGRIDELALRYLAAFGPASAADMTTWAGLTGLRPVFDRIRSGLVEYEDTNGQVLYDLPDSLIPDEDTPAPVRIIAPYDNILIGHQDRSRIMERHKRSLVMNAQAIGSIGILIDGMVAGNVKVSRDRESVNVMLHHHESDVDMEALIREVNLMMDAVYDAHGSAIRFAFDPDA